MTCHLNRRHWLAGAAGLSGAALAVTAAPRAPLGQPVSSITQPDQANPAAFIDRAFEMRDLASAGGDQAYGAVVVKDRRIVGQAPSRVVTNGDPSAHAEMEAVRDAARRLGTRDLSGCVMYSSSPPCPMCEAAAYWANIDRLVFGRDATDRGAPRLTRC